MAAKKSSALPAGVHYRVEPADLHAHLFRVTLTIAGPPPLQQVSLPVWIPGSYLVREFSKNLQGCMPARARRGAVQQLDKCSWQIRPDPAQPRWPRCSYEVYALDNSVRTAWLDAQRGFFNGTSLCLRVHGQEDAPTRWSWWHHDATAKWEVATGLAPQKINRKGFGTYLAAGYDELVDCPVEMGNFWSGEFRAGGVPHRFVVAGRPARSTARGCWPTHENLRRSHPLLAWQAQAAPQELPVHAQCTWTMATAGWSTATPPR
jgi:predicted metalloprotease with PDZ domain